MKIAEKNAELKNPDAQNMKLNKKQCTEDKHEQTEQITEQIDDKRLKDFLELMDSGGVAAAGTESKQMMDLLAQEALRVTMELNSSYHTPEEIRVLMTRLTGKPIDPTFAMFPPFYTDCGKNITIGKNVFINSGCRFQDQGGIVIGDGALIGHGVTLATLNHGLEPEHRYDLYPQSIRIGKGAWIGANAVVLPGVGIGDYAVVAAGAVVSQDVAAGTVVGGIPARVIKRIPGGYEDEI